MKKSLLLLPILLASCTNLAPPPEIAAADQTLSSPSGHITIRIQTSPAGQLTWQVTKDNQPIVEQSPIGILIDKQNLAAAVAIGKVETYQTNETYPTRSTHALAHDHGNGAKIAMYTPATKTPWTLELRAYDDGVALRYLVPESGQHVPDEATTYRIPAGSIAWTESVRGHYEDIPVRTPVEEIKPHQFMAPPLTVELPNHEYASFTEAAVYDYAGAALEGDGNRGVAVRLAHSVPPSYPFTLRYGAPGVARITKPAAILGDITTPWRVVMIGSLNDLVNTDILTNLNPAPDPKLFPNGQATDWIKPGRAVWQYIDGHDNTPEGVKEFSELAAIIGFQHNIVEGYWSRWSNDTLKDVCAYSNQRGVGIWVWLFSDPTRNLERRNNGATTRPRRSATLPASTQTATTQDRPPTTQERARLDVRNPVTRRALFQRLHEAGVTGVKIDFIDTEAKEAEDFYRDTLRDAAEFHLLVNFHGSAKPTGEQRTFPNELTREAIAGLEHRNFPPGSSAAKTQTIMPFTRFLAGSADYTPVISSSRKYNTTWTHQIATGVLFTSALQTYAANPKNIALNPGADIMKTAPSVWDETIVLPGSEIGEVAAFARRTGDTWFVAVVNGESARKMKLDLSFLGEGTYKSLTLRDKTDDPADIQVDNSTASAKDTLELDLGSGGGFVARIKNDPRRIAKTASAGKLVESHLREVAFGEFDRPKGGLSDSF